MVVTSREHIYVSHLVFNRDEDIYFKNSRVRCKRGSCSFEQSALGLQKDECFLSLATSTNQKQFMEFLVKTSYA